MGDWLSQSFLLANYVATLFMTGVIWFVQIVHYPLFHNVGRDRFLAYERRHTALTTWVVAPPMLVEAATSALLLWFGPKGAPTWQLWAGALLVVVIWVSTALVQAPCHRALSQRFHATLIDRLISSNWVRTISWSLRSLLLLSISWGMVRAN